jgi:FecR-like protein/PEGA domain-containing protein/tetratricopeptide repeat protein
MNPFKDKNDQFKERAMAKIGDLLRFDDSQTPLEQVDDLQRKRDVVSVLKKLQKLETNGVLAEPGAEEIIGEPPRTKTPALLAGLAVAAAAAIVLGLLHPFATQRASVVDDTLTAPKGISSPAVLSARTILTSGILGTSAMDLLVGKSFRPGDTINVNNGRVVVALGNRVKVLVHSNTKLGLPRLTEDHIELSLLHGEVLVSVVPDKVPMRVDVLTAHGRVVVKGTVFSVKATDEVDVSVYRGAVQVEDTRTPSYTINASEMSRLSTRNITGISPEDEMRSRTIGRLLNILGGPDLAMLEVRTMPPGAKVSLDGEWIGDAPIAAAVHSGYRELEIHLAGHTSILEHLTLPRDETVSRVFEMLSDQSPGTPRVKKQGKELSAVDLLVRAQSSRNEGRWNQSAGSLSRLINNYPQSNEAHTARVSLGIIQLRHLGQPKGALTNFDAYLKVSSSGALAQEAAYGRANVFRVTRNSQKEFQALKDFVLKYPDSMRAQEAAQRLRILEENNK